MVRRDGQLPDEALSRGKDVMKTDASEPEEVYKSDDIKLVSFLLARGGRMKETVLRRDRRVDFFVVGSSIFERVKEYDMHSKNTLVSVHDFTGAMEHVRDAIARAKKVTT